MKSNYIFKGLAILLCIGFSLTLSAQQLQSPQKVDKLKSDYSKIKNPEISLEEFMKIHYAETLMNTVNFTGCSYLDDACQGGDFENGLDATQWQGAYGYWGGGDPDPISLTDGLIGGSLFDGNAHQTVVGTGVDYYTGIATVPSGGGDSALRIGNAITGGGTELLSKTFVVTAANSNFKFSYAVVFEDPGHAYDDQPAFSVRVYDCGTGNELLNVCNLGDGSNKIVSDVGNPFFQNINGTIAYRDWTTSFVDLSQHIGKTVNVQFVNKDCALGGHFGYTYIDQVCGNIDIGDAGGVVLDPATTDTCGIGKICTDVFLGKTSDGSVTGTAVLHLNIYQNGNLVSTIDSDTIRVDSSKYCFDIDPSALGLDNSLGGFDYVITNNFSLSGYNYVNPSIGSAPDGLNLGSNNDYMINCAPSGNSGNVCLSDSTFGFTWNLQYVTNGSVATITGTVDAATPSLWSVTGWWNMSDGTMELHAVNPMGDNCNSGYTDSFTYVGKGKNGIQGTGIFGGKGTWKSYCAGSVISMGDWCLISCRYYKNQQKLSPANLGNTPVGVESGISLKVSPNPVNNRANISYTLQKKSNVNITIYNYMMQPVKMLVNASNAAGSYSIPWDGRYANGMQANAGLYKVVAIVNGKAYSTTLQVVR